MNTKEKGNVGIGKAIAYFTSICYIVSIPLNDSQDYDLIVHDYENDILYKVQVKYTSEKTSSNKFLVSLRSISGSTRKEYKVVKDTEIDILFIVTSEGKCLSIPLFDIHVRTGLTITEEIYNKYEVMV